MLWRITFILKFHYEVNDLIIHYELGPFRTVQHKFEHSFSQQ